MVRFLFFILFSFPTLAAGVLPTLPETVCQTEEAKNLSYWSTLISQRIDDLIEGSDLTGLNQDVFRNQLVTLSYLELSRQHPMGYVYANASHHLGRLVRYHYWSNQPKSELSKKDIALISGNLLGTTIRFFPITLSKKLMAHSLDLYKTLAPSLLAETICGKTFVQRMLLESDFYFPNLPEARYQELISLLRNAYATSTPVEFARRFVAFEQTYLQYTMYASPEINLGTATGMLDKMRFIPFNGERNLSFYEWCEARKCGKTSLDLAKRIEFDRLVIEAEFEFTGLEPQTLRQRMESADIRKVSMFILKKFCERQRLPTNLCQ